jgi:hypothetical protein
MALVGSIPGCTDSDDYIGSLALEKGVIDVGLELRWWWDRRANRDHGGEGYKGEGPLSSLLNLLSTDSDLASRSTTFTHDRHT